MVNLGRASTPTVWPGEELHVRVRGLCRSTGEAADCCQLQRRQMVLRAKWREGTQCGSDGTLHSRRMMVQGDLRLAREKRADENDYGPVRQNTKKRSVL